MFGALGCVLAPNKIRISAPMRPNPIPIDFNHVIFSFIKIADITSNKTGTNVITTELLMGVERLSPLKNINILRVMPKNAHEIILSQSPRSIFSEGKKKLISQNNNNAPLILNRINPNG